MTQRAKLELEINKPTHIELLYDECVEGSNQYGQYYLYAVKSDDGREYSFFPTANVHEQLKQLRRGDKATITKLAAKRGSKIVTSFDVKTSQRTTPVSVTTQNNNVSEKEDLKEYEDGLYQIMLLSLKEAVSISTEIGTGFIDPTRVGLSLFIARSKSNGF